MGFFRKYWWVTGFVVAGVVSAAYEQYTKHDSKVEERPYENIMRKRFEKDQNNLEVAVSQNSTSKNSNSQTLTSYLNSK